VTGENKKENGRGERRKEKGMIMVSPIKGFAPEQLENDSRK
jgi:hypothetical protein